MYFPVQDNETQKNAPKQHEANKLKQKLNFDEQHKAAHKIVNIHPTTENNDQASIRSSTIQCHRCPGKPCCCLKRQSSPQKRENNLKVLKPRPKYLTPSWKESNANATSLYNDSHPVTINIISVIPPRQKKTMLDAWNEYHNVPLSLSARDDIHNRMGTLFTCSPGFHV